MPGISKAKRARQQNGRKGGQSRKVSVEEVPDEGDPVPAPEPCSISHLSHDHHTHPDDDSDGWDFDLGNELPDIDCDELSPDHGPDLDEEIISAPEISDETELDVFSAFLRDAQGAAQRAEREREKSRKRSRTYLKNAPRTKSRRVQQAKDLKKKGFRSVFDYLGQKKTEKETAPSESHPEQVSETASISVSETVSISDSDSGSDVEPDMFNSPSDAVLDENKVMVSYNNDGNVLKEPEGYTLRGKYKDQPFRIILVTHDESTLYANDR